ncbi:hypothetical protein DL771_009592 [Monosporascus sp. 5C6A]|nr:hypothetical protein DL771_009592 [Monosporascus sp. 5C6A]
MADTRQRHSGRRSPTLNPARASMPVSLGYNNYGGDLHAIPTARYDASVPRRGTDYRAPHSPTTTITTYNVTKDPNGVSKSASARDSSHHKHRRSSTVDPPQRPIIVTTNHAKPQTSSSHASSGTRTSSPPRDSYRGNDDAYYAQPASSVRSRSQHRHHGHTQSASLDNDEFYRLRERVGGDERLRAPDPYRHARPQSLYPGSALTGGAAVTAYEDEGFEYATPGDLARYDIEHGRARRSRGESVDRPYYRPSVNIPSGEAGRHDSRSRGPPPTSSGLDRYNRAAAAGTYDRPSVTVPVTVPVAVPTPPVVAPLPPVEPPRRPALIEPVKPVQRSPSVGRAPRPRPISLYQDPSPRMSHPDDIYRSRDDERIHKDRRDRAETFRDENIASRGFGIRTDLLEPAGPRSAEPDRRDYDDRRLRREIQDREPRRFSDEELDRARNRDGRKSLEDALSRSRLDEDRDNKDAGRGDKIREKVASGLGIAAAAMGLGKTAEVDNDRDSKDSSRRRRDIADGKDPVGSRAAERYAPRDNPVPAHKSSPQGEPVVVERREHRRDRADSNDSSSSRELDRDRGRDRGREPDRERDYSRPARERDADRERATSRARDHDRDKERDRDRDREKELEREWERERERELERERERERNRRDADGKLPAGHGGDLRDESPHSDGSGAASRRRRRNSTAAFDPTDTRDLTDLKTQLAAMDSKSESKDNASSSKERTPEADAVVASGSEKQPESRGRESSQTSEEKQVRVVSPPREKKLEKPIKGILKQPRAQFPEDENPIREGVAPHKDDKTKKDVPPGARWTKVNRKMVNPEALTIGKERFEVRDDFVIVLRVLSKEEIQAYATATAQIRGKQDEAALISNGMIRTNTITEMRRREARDTDDDRDYDSRDTDDRRRRHDRDRDSETDRERERERRRYRELLEEEQHRPKAIEYDTHGDDRAHRRRSHKDGGYDSDNRR